MRENRKRGNIRLPQARDPSRTHHMHHGYPRILDDHTRGVKVHVGNRYLRTCFRDGGADWGSPANSRKIDDCESLRLSRTFQKFVQLARRTFRSHTCAEYCIREKFVRDVRAGEGDVNRLRWSSSSKILNITFGDLTFFSFQGHTTGRDDPSWETYYKGNSHPLSPAKAFLHSQQAFLVIFSLAGS